MGGEDGKTKCLKVNVYFFILVSDGRRSKTPKGEFKLHERDLMLSLRKKITVNFSVLLIHSMVWQISSLTYYKTSTKLICMQVWNS